METKMSDKKLVDFIEEYIDDSELLSELADVQLDDIRLNVERRELELLCSAAAAPGELLLRAVETSLIKAFTLNAAMINCSVTEEKPEETPKEPMSETGLAKLLLSLRREFPAANGFLNDAQCFMLGDTVSVQLKSGADVINNLGASKRFAQMIFERFGEDVGVEFTDSGAPVDDGEVQQYQEELDSGIRSAFADKVSQEKDLTSLTRTYDEYPFSTKYSVPIYGSVIKTKPISLSDVASDSGSVVVWGTVFSFESRDTRDGKRKIINFCITDKTSSYSVKIFELAENCESLLKNIKDGVAVMVRGVVNYDSYMKCDCINARAVTTIDLIEKKDEAPEKRVELHLHTTMSAMDGVSSATKLVERAIAWGHKAIAITDHGVVQAFPEACAAAKGKIKILYGMVGYYFDDRVVDPAEKKKKYNHIIFIAKNYVGLKNLYKIITKSNLEYFSRKPGVPRGRHACILLMD